jgi:hypothetical protein
MGAVVGAAFTGGLGAAVEIIRVVAVAEARGIIGRAIGLVFGDSLEEIGAPDDVQAVARVGIGG